MTQIKQGLFKSPALTHVELTTEDNGLSKDKSPSPELFEMIQAAANNLMSFGGLWKSIKKKGHDEGFSERELEDMLRPLLKPQLNKDQIYYLFHTEEKKEQSKQTYQKLRNIPTVTPNKELEHKTPIPPKEPDPDPELPEEDPQAIEIQFLKEQIAQLQDALKKTEQFQPAAQLQEQRDEYGTDENKVFQWLEQRDNGVNCYWYPNYGIELFRNRILTQLKNKGVTTFKRLYFEV